MESTGKPDMIQLSQITADILSLNGKQHWLVQRKDSVEAKGKGSLQTYWLNPSLHKKSGFPEHDPSETGSVASSIVSQNPEKDMVKRDRLVNWMTQLLLDHIKKVVSPLILVMKVRQTPFGLVRKLTVLQPHTVRIFDRWPHTHQLNKLRMRPMSPLSSLPKLV
jgi:Adenylate and Guanylate cyclase catalytic domain